MDIDALTIGGGPGKSASVMSPLGERIAAATRKLPGRMYGGGEEVKANGRPGSA